MKQIWVGQVSRAASTYGEHAPMATACCNACRACVTSNLLALAGAAALAIAGAARRLVRAA